LAIIFIEIFKLLGTPMINGGRFDIQRQNRLLLFPPHARQLVNVNEKKQENLFFEIQIF
jgi:hypothetical protein